MQITIGQEAKVVKTGTNKQGGAWELIAVKSAKGTEYTTFDKKVKHLGAGSIIEIGEPEENNGKFSFKEVVSVITEVAPAVAETKEPGAYKRDIDGIQFEYELKARLQQVDRVSIETQTAYNGIIDLAESGVSFGEHMQEFNQLFGKALKWAESRMDESMNPSAGRTKVEPKPASKPAEKPTVTRLPRLDGQGDGGQEANGKEVDPDHPFPNIGALLTWCSKQGINRAKFIEIVQVKEKDIPNVNIEDAHHVIQDYLKQNPKDTNDPEGLFK